MKKHSVTTQLSLNQLENSKKHSINLTISIRMNESAFSMSHVVLPVSFIDWSIFPELFSSSMSHAIFPLSFVDWSIFELIRRQKYCIWIFIWSFIINKVSTFLKSSLRCVVCVIRFHFNRCSELRRWSMDILISRHFSCRNVILLSVWFFRDLGVIQWICLIFFNIRSSVEFVFILVWLSSCITTIFLEIITHNLRMISSCILITYAVCSTLWSAATHLYPYLSMITLCYFSTFSYYFYFLLFYCSSLSHVSTRKQINIKQFSQTKYKGKN